MIIETAIALILIFGALVMFHEMGHFISARAVGIRVEEFAFGFGPRLIRLFRRGDTEYTIHPFPLGGFCKLAGMEPGEENIPDGFQAQAAWKRALVIFAGPVASFLLAVLAFLSLGIFWGFPNGEKVENRIAAVFPNTVAARINMRTGDRIVEINSRKITSGNRMVRVIFNSPGKPLHLIIERNGSTFTRTAAPAWNIKYAGFDWSFFKPNRGQVTGVLNPDVGKKTGIGEDDVLVSLNGNRVTSGVQMAKLIGEIGAKPVHITVKRGNRLIDATTDPFVSAVRFMGVQWSFPGGYALPNERLTHAEAVLKESGFKLYDEIKSVDGKSINSGGALAAAIKAHKSGPLVFKVKRGDKPAAVTLNPTPADIAGLDAQLYIARGLFGFVPEPVLVKTSSLSGAIKEGLATTWRHVDMIITSLAPSRIGKNVGGPILIAQQTSSMVALGPYYVILMAGMLSMSLFFVNLLPIPVLDGGHLAIMLVEAIRRKRLTPYQMQFATLIGLAIIGLIIVSVMWSDIFKLSHGQVPQ